MCLYSEMRKYKADEIKAEARKRGYIRVWKICEQGQTGWYYGGRWLKGVKKAQNLKVYNGGWYAYLDLEGAKIMRKILRYRKIKIKVCYAKLSWIKRLGRDSRRNRIGIFTHLAFPDWDKGDMTIREFRAMCKEKGKK